MNLLKPTLLALACCFCAFASYSQVPAFQWVATVGDGQFDQGMDVAIDGGNNVYTLSAFEGTIDADPGPAVLPFTNSGSNGFGLLISKFDVSGNLAWAKAIPNLELFPEEQYFVVDAAGNLTIVGTFADAIDFDPGPGNAMLQTSGTQDTDVFVLRLDANGDFVWVKSFGSSAEDHGIGVALDPAGNIFLSGLIQGPTDLDPSPTGVANVQPVTQSGMFLSKWDGNGGFLWGKLVDGVYPRDLAADGLGNVYSTGVFTYDVDFDPDTLSSQILSAQNTLDGYLLKLDAGGHFVWAKQIAGTNGHQECRDLVVDSAGKLLLCGNYDGAVDFDPGPGSYYMNANVDPLWFLLQLDANGDFAWVKSYGGSMRSQGFATTYDAFGNIYTAGNFTGTADFDDGPGIYNLQQTGTVEDFAYVKLDAAGNLIWADHIGDLGQGSFGEMAVDGLANLYMTGLYFGTIDFDPSADSSIVTDYGNGDTYLLKLSQDSCANLALVIDSVANIGCSSLGFGSAYATNGQGPYSYEWNTLPPTLDSIATFSAAELYTLTVTDANGCSAARSILIDGPRTFSGFDLHANLVGSSLRPGVPGNLWLDGFNDGCIPTSGQLILTLDSAVTFNTATPTPDSVVGSRLVWNFTNLTYVSPHIIPVVTVTPDTSLAVGSTVCFDVEIAPWPGDIDTSNNARHVCISILNSFDPNAKTVYPAGACDEGYVLPGTKLTYTLQFQNTGTAEALKVAVTDSLSPHLDPSTLKVIAASHPGLITDVLAANVIRFRFQDIHLPDSATNEAGSHGYVIFEVDPQPGLTVGTRIENRVGIVFDYNTPVFTNTVRNTITNSVPSIAAGISFNGTAFVASPAGATYQWLACGNDLSPIPGANGQSFTPPNSTGYYAVQVTVGSCSETTACAFAGGVQAPSGTLQSRVHIFPNPTQDGELTLRLGDIRKPMHVQVCDMLGRPVWAQATAGGGDTRLQLPANPGLYFVTLRSGNGEQAVWKIVRE